MSEHALRERDRKPEGDRDAVPLKDSQTAEEWAKPTAPLRGRSIIRAFAILRAFNSPDEWATSTELSRRTRIPAATVSRLVKSLADAGVVTRNDARKYRRVPFCTT